MWSTQCGKMRSQSGLATNTLKPNLAQSWVNTLRPRQNGRHFADDIFKWIFLNENVSIPIKIPMKFVPKCPINNIPALVQIMAWRRPGDKPLSEPMMVSLTTHIYVTRPQWVNWVNNYPIDDLPHLVGYFLNRRWPVFNSTLMNTILWKYISNCHLQNVGQPVQISVY